MSAPRPHAVVVASVLAVSLVYVPWLFAPFLAPKWSALEVGASLAFALALARPIAPRPARTVLFAALGVLATTVVSALAAPSFAPAVDALARWVSLFALAYAVLSVDEDPREREQLALVAAVAGGAVSALGLWQHLELTALPIPVISTPGSTFGNRNLGAECVALSAPFALAMALLRAGPVRAVTASSLALDLLYLAATRARGAWLGALFALGLVVWRLRPRWSPRAVALGVVLGAATLAAATVPGRFNPRHAGDHKRYASLTEFVRGTLDASSPAARNRRGLWRRTLVLVREHPMLGVGPGRWPVEFPRVAEPGARADGVYTVAKAPLQAHNDLLERLSETGIVGLAAYLALLVAVAQRALRRASVRDDAPSLAAAGTLLGVVALGLPGFPLEMPGTLTFTALALGLVSREETSAEGPSPRWRHALLLVSAVMVVLASGRAVRRVRSSLALRRAEVLLARDRSPQGTRRALALLGEASRQRPEEFRPWLRSAQMHLRLREAPAAERDAREALRREPYAPLALTALAEAQLQRGDPLASRETASRSLALLHDQPQALYVRALASLALHEDAAAHRDGERIRALANEPPDDDTARAARAVMHQ